MFAEDRVLIGVVRRKRDLAYARDQHWYRIPQAQLPKGVNAEYIALFLSGAVFKERSGGIHYYAEKRGLELVRRRDLLPEESDHPRADDVYYQVQLGDLIEKNPPVLNPSRRIISFVYTTWDRFVKAREISDLYSTADYFVDRIYHALRSTGLTPQRIWQAEYREAGRAAELRILCEKGTVVASTERNGGAVYLDDSQKEDKILAAIKAEIARQGGPVYVSIPVEDI
jgi:hypothetical protein